METNDQIHCPQCNSTQLTANKKGFSGGKAVAGGVLFGPIGLLAGTAGSKKIVITCLNCGKQFKPGQGVKPAGPGQQPKLIWDDRLKAHVLNPNYKKGDFASAPLPVVLFIIALVVFVIYLMLK